MTRAVFIDKRSLIKWNNNYVFKAFKIHLLKYMLKSFSGLKRQSEIRPSFAYLTQNSTGNSMVAIILVKNVRLRNGNHFKKEPPKNQGAICDQRVSLIKK